MKITEITFETLKSLLNETIIVEINGLFYKGNLKKFKGNYAIINEDTVKRSFNPKEVTSIYYNQQLEEMIKKESDGYHVTSEKGKNLGGPYDSRKQAEKRLKQVEYFKHVKEGTNHLLKEKLRERFFNKMNEEIVNADNVGKLTPQDSNPRAKKRDSIAKGLKNVKQVKGDSPEEAKHRLATFIVLNKNKKD